MSYDKTQSNLSLKVAVLAAIFSSGSALASSSGGGSSSSPDTRQAQLQPYCDASSMLPVDVNPAVRGPWTVGSRTLTIRNLKTEIFYPAQAGSAAGKQLKKWDIREFFPATEAAKLPDAVSIRTCETCYADLPIDTTRGPYPVIVYVHGTAATRISSLPLFEHWASRGFVVVSADNPNITQKDVMTSPLNILRADQKGNTKSLLAEMRSPSYFGASSFLRGRIDARRMGLGGHSAGGVAINDLGSESGVRVIIPMASGGTKSGSQLISSVVMGGLLDKTAKFDTTTSTYNSSPVKKRLVGIADMGHVGFVNVCRGAELQRQYGLEIPEAMENLLADGCGTGYISPEAGWDMIKYASTAAYEETLKCSKGSADKLRAFRDVYGSRNVYQEQLK